MTGRSKTGAAGGDRSQECSETGPNLQDSTRSGAFDGMAEWRSGAAGTASGLLTRCAVAPLDVIKIRLQLQVSSSAVRRSSHWSVRHGLSPPRGGPHTAAAVGRGRRQSLTRRALRQVIEKTGRALGHAASAAPASVPGETAQKYRGVLPTLRVIVREEGAWALWKGNLTAEFLWGGYMGTQFLVYHMAQRAGAGVGAAGRAPGGQVGVDLACGAAAGAAATTATYPLDLLRTRLAAQQEPRVYRGLWHAAASVVRREGARRLYAGLSPALVQVAPYMGIQARPNKPRTPARPPARAPARPCAREALTPPGACSFAVFAVRGVHATASAEAGKAASSRGGCGRRSRQRPCAAARMGGGAGAAVVRPRGRMRLQSLHAAAGRDQEAHAGPALPPRPMARPRLVARAVLRAASPASRPRRARAARAAESLTRRRRALTSRRRRGQSRF